MTAAQGAAPHRRNEGAHAVGGGEASRNLNFESISLQRRVTNELFRGWASMAPAGRSSHSGTEGSNPASSVSVAENGDSTDADLVQGRAMLGGGVRIVFDAGDPRLDLGDGNIVGGVGVAARHVAVLARLGAGEDGPEFILILAGSRGHPGVGS